MKTWRFPFALLAAACLMPPAQTTAAPAPRNLFHELLGQPESALDAKIGTAWRQLFHGDGKTQRIYYPAAPDTAYIADIASNDIRTEGMSYGMMLCVQLNHRAEFDRLWRWAKRHMYHAAGPRAGYFAWHCRFDGTQLDPGSASDGEEWFAMALLFAAHRWAAAPGGFDYHAEAQSLLRAMLHQPDGDGVTAIFNRREKQVVFAPTPAAAGFTDPSYHLPAFYELWARWAADPADRAFWAEAARTSRAFFQRAANPRTGLMPEYSRFDGSPLAGGPFAAGRGDFRFDAWRTLANVALDHAWWQSDPWQTGQCDRVLRFFAPFGDNLPNQFTLAGQPLSDRPSTGLFAMAAVAGLAADPGLARPFVQRLWDLPVPSGQWRYYDGMLYFLALLEAGGRFRIHPAPATP
jgi:oligosaccharide reducing-end xylanase